MAKKTYLLTIEYDSDTDTIEYLQEEILEDDSLETKTLGAIDLESRFDKETLDYIREHYIVGET
tara:strand:+ start:6508 stop:6699 length:192 start_codon:yes stop_codon:yes gene_type:complete